MGIYSNRTHWNWTPVAGDIKKPQHICPRCKNAVQYFLAYDGDSYGLLGFLKIKSKQFYSYKCPICPNYESIDKNEAKFIIESNKNASN